MNADSCFFIGSSHEVCEDYALSGESSGLVYAAVSDGCSSSEHTDFGARFLCHVAARQLRTFGDFNPDRVIWEAAGMARQTALPNTCLDATLLFAVQTSDGVKVCMYGDGLVVAKRRDGEVEVYSVEFACGAPAYLSYRLSDGRMKGYMAEFDEGAHVLKTSWPSGAITENKRDGMNGAGFSFQTSVYEAVFLMSDGAETFQYKENGAPKSVEQMEVLKQLTSIKGFKGKFVQRRTKAFLHKFCRANDWKHSDDLSVAAIYMGDPVRHPQTSPMTWAP